MIKIGIAEDQALVRESLSIVLDLEKDLTVLWMAETGSDAIDAMQTSQVDLVLMDLRMPVLDGVVATKHITSKHPATKVVILTTFDHDEWILDAIHAGASICFLKEIPPKLLIHAIRLIHTNEFQPDNWSPEWRRYAPEIQMRANFRSLSVNHVTKSSVIGNEVLNLRELELLKRIGEGQSNTEIAKAMFLSEGTVKNYVSNLYNKIGVSNRNEAIRLARKIGVS